MEFPTTMIESLVPTRICLSEETPFLRKSCFHNTVPITKVTVIFLTFICLCIASISLKYNQKCATFSRFICFYKFLYMFQAVPPSIIRSTKLYIRRQVLSNQYCSLLLSWMCSISSTIAAGSSIGLTIPDVVCTVLCS